MGDISQKKFGSAYAQSSRKCSNIEILAKIEGKEAKFFSKIYEGHIRIGFTSKKKSKLSHACVPLKCNLWTLLAKGHIFQGTHCPTDETFETSRSGTNRSMGQNSISTFLDSICL